MTRFTPGPATERQFRDALGAFATGVTVITCRTGAGPLGITANSFSSLSLDPPLVLWSPAKFSRRFNAFAEASHFAVHVLGADHFALCRAFAREGDAFDGFDWSEGAHGVPLLEHCLARFECTQVACHDAGDHAIVVGAVTAVATTAGEPLVFAKGSYGRFTEQT